MIHVYKYSLLDIGWKMLLPYYSAYGICYVIVYKKAFKRFII